MNVKVATAIISSLLCFLATAGLTDANDTTGPTHSAASVVFVVHIPETLKLSINTASMSTQGLTSDIDSADSGILDHSSHRLPLVEAIGQLTHGATMALTADTNTSRSNALAMLTWTASGMAITGGRQSDVFTPKGKNAKANAYHYRKEIPPESLSHVSELNYMLCSP